MTLVSQTGIECHIGKCYQQAYDDSATLKQTTKF